MRLNAYSEKLKAEATYDENWLTSWIEIAETEAVRDEIGQSVLVLINSGN